MMNEKTQTNYQKYRGKCRELSQKACDEDPTLTLVRGWYHCPLWGKQQHWWCERPDNSILDPTKDQFPSKGTGEYQKFTGICECEHCGAEITEQGAFVSPNRRIYCNYTCYGNDILPPHYKRTTYHNR
jgi:hypothetical protein